MEQHQIDHFLRSLGCNEETEKYAQDVILRIYELGKSEERERWVSFVNGAVNLIGLTAKMIQTMKDAK